MKKIYCITILILGFITSSVGQQTYCDFEGVKIMYFGVPAGQIDSLAANPAPNTVDSSALCAKYIRDTTLYDYIKVYPIKKLMDVTPYADNNLQTPKITMKLYSTAAVGTIVQLQLGLKSVDNYPAGIHSEYVAATTVQNEWENVTFNYFDSPDGSLVSPTEIDKMIILFHPNSHDRDTVYLDDISGPELFDTGIPVPDALPSFKLHHNNPNPAKEKTNINFQLSSGGSVSLEIYDMLGNSIFSFSEKNMMAGNHSIPVETSTIPNGVYFYVLKKDGLSQAKRMLVAK